MSTLDSIFPLRLGRFSRSFLGRNSIQKKHQLNARRLVRAASQLFAEALKIDSAEAQLPLLQRCVTQFRQACPLTDPQPYQLTCPHYQLANVYMAIGKCYERMDDLVGAAAAYRAAVRACDYMVEARLLLANAIRDQADSQAAIDEAEQVSSV